MRLVTSAVLASLLFLMPSMALARTWYITPDGTGDAATIQAGIDSAEAGDTVLVAPGIYTWTSQFASGDFMISMKSGVSLMSQSGPEVTSIDAEDNGTVIVCLEVDDEALIEGFTITGGHGMGGPTYFGGGILCHSSSLTIRGNIIRDNTADHDGGGISCGTNSSARIVDNHIRNNSADPGNGGGINCWACAPTLEIRNNLIEHNDAQFGGGIAFSSSSPTSVVGNIIVANTADDGGGIQCESSSPTIEGNVIALNEGRVVGGGIRCHTSSPTIIACTLVENIGLGAGLANCCGSSPNLIRCIVAYNSGAAVLGSETTELFCCDVYGNTNGDWDGDIADQLGSEGNISEDPIFCGEANYPSDPYRLDIASPCARRNPPCLGELIGARGTGCSGPVASQPSTWGRVKAMYR